MENAEFIVKSSRYKCEVRKEHAFTNIRYEA